MKYISSKNNEIIKKIKYLHTKKGREELSLFIVEGEKLVNEAFESNRINTVLISETYPINNILFDHPEIFILKDDIFKNISDTISPQGIMALVKMKEQRTAETNFEVFAEDVQDPGNIGTILRTCESFGVQKLYLSCKCADPYNLKAVRASMGSILRIDIEMIDDIKAFLVRKREEGFKIFAGHLNGEDISKLSIGNIKKVLLIVGNESFGVSSEAIAMCDKLLKIPIYGANESLNVSVATGILLHEIKKQMI